MLKRIFDYLISLIAIVLFCPLIALLACLIRNKLGSPILFRQKRPGKNGKSFEMIKFRTMLDAFDDHGNPLPDSERLPSFGKLLRSTSLDELPSLWNILKGEMSLVGPRPLLMEYLPLYNKEQMRRHEALPGITGWAQINGRNAISWEEKFKLDVWYVDNQSFWLDVKILFLTFKKVLIRDGISSEGEVTAKKFNGNSQNEIIAILGASGHGRVVADTAELLGFKCVFFDDAFPELKNNAHWPVIGNTQDLLTKASQFFGVVVAIGNNKIRLEKIMHFKSRNIHLPVLIHPNAFISPYAKVDEGSVIFSGVTVNAYAQIGMGNILNSNCSVDHDCKLGNAVHVSPGARLAGGVTVGDCSWIGIGAAIKQSILIGAYSTVGAGAAVINNIPESTTVVGVPAKSLY